MNAVKRSSVALILGVVLSSAGCESERASEPQAQSQDLRDVFERTESIVLEEPGLNIIGRLYAVRPSASGDTLLILDPMSHRVRLHGRDGSFIRSRGGPHGGDGPGEFRTPWTVAWDESGHIWVADQFNPRLTLLTPDLQLDTTFAVDPARLVRNIHRIGSRLLFQVRTESGGPQLDLMEPDGSLARSFHPPHPRAQEPYWIQFSLSVTAVSDSLVAVAFPMEYPLHIYSAAGVLLSDDFGHPPPSWRQAELLEAGAFAIGGSGSPQGSPMAWRRSFTRVHSLGFASDVCLMVVHEIPDREERALLRFDFLADVYDIRTGRKVLEDVEMPGTLIHASTDGMFFLVRSPPDPWEIEVWRARAGGVQCNP